MARKKISTKIVIKKELKQVFNKSIEVPDGLITNESIRTTFFDYLKKSSYIPSSALSTIWKLIDRQVVIPVNVKKKGFLSFLSKKLKNNSIIPFSYYEGVMAFYSGRVNRIYMLIDNIKKYHSANTANAIAKTLTHEFQHMQCCNYPQEFFNLHKSTFEQFYCTFFNTVADLYRAPKEMTADPNAAAYFCKTILFLFDHLIAHPGSTFTKYDLMLYFNKCQHVYEKEKSSKSIDKCAEQIAIHITNSALGILTGQYYNAVRRYKPSELLCYKSLYSTYNKLYHDAGKYKSFYGQELIFPSELISVLSQEDSSPKMYAFINRL